ncbi:MAG TPA: malto-oligosyltrehalose trehalohydrolase [Gemmatimonadales bacterium]|nr:malto-oligosyltrehalose trehalohydrolase [Gemmatimonadales bacterium]
MTGRVSRRSPRHHQARRLPIGAEPTGAGVHFRVWAPRRQQVEVVLEPSGEARPLAPEPGGYFAALVDGAGAGTRYRYRLDGGDALPDPASRFQPEGPHGPSEVIDPGRFTWTDAGWAGLRLEGQVLYELHVGTFTADGTWAAAAAALPPIAELGLTVIEVMPVADFPGRFGWGYDGVNLFAPTRLYGRPDDFRGFVDRAHALGLAVILDVVYNHLGPDGNHLREFATEYFTDRHATAWGEALNFDGPDAGPVREYFLANAGYWIDEFHLDGLRLDATHAIDDASPEHILAAVGARARQAARGRDTMVIAEDELQRISLALPATLGGYGLDGIWHDDFHHITRVAATGRREGYFRRYQGSGAELAAAATRTLGGESPRPEAFVNFLQNHDQVSVAPGGRRLHQLTSPGRHRALTALLLLAPGTPMLFMGDEFAASAPFLYFADHEPRLAELVREGRARHLAQFASFADPLVQAGLADPSDPGTFARCRLDPGERDRHAWAIRLHRDLLALRRRDPVLRARGSGRVDGAALGESALALRFRARGGAERVLLVNLGGDLELGGEEPLLPPAGGASWALRWSSEDPAYGGGGTPEAARAGRLAPAESALLLGPGIRGV